MLADCLVVSQDNYSKTVPIVEYCSCIMCKDWKLWSIGLLFNWNCWSEPFFKLICLAVLKYKTKKWFLLTRIKCYIFLYPSFIQKICKTSEGSFIYQNKNTDIITMKHQFKKRKERNLVVKDNGGEKGEVRV